MSKWKFNGVSIERNPSEFIVTKTKDAVYSELIGGGELRKVNNINTQLEATWEKVRTPFRDYLYSLYLSNSPIKIETHDNEEWTVIVKGFGNTPIAGGKVQRYDVRMIFEIM